MRDEVAGHPPPTPNEVEYYEVPEWQRLDVNRVGLASG
jgi:hypothetical protein